MLTHSHTNLCVRYPVLIHSHTRVTYTVSVCDPPLTHSHTTPYTQILCVPLPYTQPHQVPGTLHTVSSPKFSRVCMMPHKHKTGSHTHKCVVHIPTRRVPFEFLKTGRSAPQFSKISTENALCVCALHTCVCAPVCMSVCVFFFGPQRGKFIYIIHIITQTVNRRLTKMFRVIMSTK